MLDRIKDALWLSKLHLCSYTTSHLQKIFLKYQINFLTRSFILNNFSVKQNVFNNMKCVRIGFAIDRNIPLFHSINDKTTISAYL